jgi:hypothetical protein
MRYERNPISRAFIAAVLLAAGVVLQHPREPEAWSTAAGIIAAAVSGGARKNGDQR